MSAIKISATVTPNADGSVSVSIPLQSFTIPAIKPPDVQIAVFMPNGQVGVPYSGQLTGSGGKAPYSYAFTPALPAGMKLDAKTGVVTGTPTVDGVYAGTAAAVDANKIGGTQQVSFSISAAAQPPPPPPTEDIGAPDPAILGTPRSA